MAAAPRQWSLLVLTAAAASADAVCYLGLGQVFPANMTGNTVLIAIGVTNHDLSGAARSALALVGFVLGAVSTGLSGADETDYRAPRRRANLMGAESAVLTASVVWWLAIDGPPVGAARNALVTLFGIAMGLQSGVVTSLHLGVSTTFITGTWTAVSRTVAERQRARIRSASMSPGRDHVVLKVAVLASYLAAALLTGFLYASFGAVAAVDAAGLTAAAGTGSALARSKSASC